MGSDGTNHIDGSNAVGYSDQGIFVDSVLASPESPLPIYRTRGVHENSVKIEEDGGTGKRGHSPFFITAWGSSEGMRRNLQGARSRSAAK
jgi:hypothetical protein